MLLFPKRVYNTAMKNIFIIVSILVVMGCASGNKQVAATEEYKYPPGKTDADFGIDEETCLKRSGKTTGFFAQFPLALASNLGGANQRYNDCMKEMGWQ
jgi:hypothetical protein